METHMDRGTKNSSLWAKYYQNHKRFWCDPNIKWEVKLVVRTVELHRSDSKGWSISVRKMSEYLGISINTARKAINKAIDSGYLESTSRVQRKRRKLRLSVSLRAPVEFESFTGLNLSQWKTQPVLRTDTPAVSSRDSINNKAITKEIGSDENKKDYRESKGYKRFMEQRKKLGLMKRL